MGRYRSRSARGIRVFAVAGTNTVSFGVSATTAARKGLLGFMVERVDDVTGESRYVNGFKVFRSLVPQPDADTWVSTYDHPIQSLVWADFTCEAGHAYTFRFHPMRGTPAKPRRTAAPAVVHVITEPLHGGMHDVFFNRGVASSQAYAREFGNERPDAIVDPARRAAAFAWLSRDLDEALLDVIASAGPGDALRGSFYEFSYGPVLQALATAVTRGVDVRLVVDCKVNEHWAKAAGSDQKVFVESSPRVENLAAIDAAGIPPTSIVRREARASAISHNKFLVLLRGGAPVEVWTGSTNLTEGGIFGQSNVGHLARDPVVAATYLAYWTILADDPGGRSGDAAAVVRSRNADFRAAVAALTGVPAGADSIPVGSSAVFSPRTGAAPLQLYAGLIATAHDLACATFAFGVNATIAGALAKNTATGPLCFLLLETATAQGGGTTPTVVLDSRNNVYRAWGSALKTPIGQWVAETTTRTLGLNSHVAYIHDKFLLRDPLGADPVVVTGSANFSAASTNDNDENMLLIRGDRRVADIYFTEFDRLFNHYYFRSVVERIEKVDPVGTVAVAAEVPSALDLVEDDSWLAAYDGTSLKSKRAARFVQMAGTALT